MHGQGLEMREEGSEVNNSIHPEVCQEQVASYVCDMTGSLKKLALEADMKFLAYLIDMVHLEAFNKMNSANSSSNKAGD